jgi:hypothetical protein
VGLSTPRGGGNGLTTREHVLFAFNLVIKFFEEFRTNYQGVNTEKLCTFKSFSIDPMKV